MSLELQNYANTIDICGDGKKDGAEYENLRKILLKDAEKLLEERKGGKITPEEYDRYLERLKEILEKHHTSVQDAYDRYAQEEKIILQETENKSTGLWKMIRNTKTEISVFSERHQTNDLLHWYTNAAGNYTIPVKVFESKLRTDDIKDLNTKEITSYLEYLSKKWQLNKETMEEKFGENNMVEFMKIWSTKIQKFTLKSNSANDTTVFKEVGEYFFWKEDEVEAILAKIFQEKLGSNNIQEAQEMLKTSKLSISNKLFKNKNNERNNNETNDQYHILIEKAYVAFGNGKNKKDFQRKFEKLLESGFSSYDATFKMFGGDVGIKAFKDIMAEVSKIEKKEEEKSKKEFQEYLKTVNSNNYASLEDFFNLPSDKQEKFIKEKNNTELGKLFEKYQKNRNDSERAKTLETSDTATITALNYSKNWKSPKDFNKAIDISTKVRNRETGVNIAVIRSVPGLENITGISQVWKDPKKVELLTAYLKAKPHPTEEEKNILALIPLKEEQMREFIMAKKNITEWEYADLKKSGKIQDFVFAENLIDSIEPNTTLSQLDKKLDIAINDKVFTSPEKEQKYTDAIKKNNIESILASLPDNGEKVFLQKIGNDNCFVTKNDDKYVLSINGKTEICSTQEEVNNTIDTYDFFHDMGLRSLIPFMKPFLATVKNCNSICPEFDIQKGILPWEQKNTLLRAVDTIFSLDMNEKIVSTGTETLVSKFEERLNMIDQKARLRGKWILTAQGGFSREQLNQVLMMKKEVL